MAARGLLTKEVEEKAKELLGYEIDVTELRLMPCIQYIMVNNRVIDRAKINQDDRDILAKWEKAGYIDDSEICLSITKKFWDIINNILWHSYVNIK